MKKLCVLLYLSAALPVAVLGQDADIEAVKKLLADSEVAFNQGNREVAVSAFADDAMIVEEPLNNPGMSLRGAETLRCKAQSAGNSESYCQGLQRRSVAFQAPPFGASRQHPVPRCPFLTG